MARRTEVSLFNFFIFNSTFGPKEGEVRASLYRIKFSSLIKIQTI